MISDALELASLAILDISEIIGEQVSSNYNVTDGHCDINDTV